MTSAIIINYHSEEQTVAFVKNELLRVRPCMENSGDRLSIVIVDNDSSDESLNALQNAFDGLCDIEIVPSQVNLGFARGNNLGFKVAKEKFSPDIILFSNNDIHLTSDDVITVLSKKLHSLDQAGAIGPMVEDLDGKLQSPRPFLSFFKSYLLVYWGNLLMTQRMKREVLQLDYPQSASAGWHYVISGCFFMVKALDYESCGGMDPNTFLYAEESILAERLKRIGKKVWYCPEVKVIHEHGSTTKKYFDLVKIRDMKFESDCYYYRTYIHTPEWQITLGRLTLKLKKLFHR